MPKQSSPSPAPQSHLPAPSGETTTSPPAHQGGEATRRWRRLCVQPKPSSLPPSPHGLSLKLTEHLSLIPAPFVLKKMSFDARIIHAIRSQAPPLVAVGHHPRLLCRWPLALVSPALTVPVWSEPPWPPVAAGAWLQCLPGCLGCFLRTAKLAVMPIICSLCGLIHVP